MEVYLFVSSFLHLKIDRMRKSKFFLFGVGLYIFGVICSLHLHFCVWVLIYFFCCLNLDKTITNNMIICLIISVILKPFNYRSFVLFVIIILLFISLYM